MHLINDRQKAAKMVTVLHFQDPCMFHENFLECRCRRSSSFSPSPIPRIRSVVVEQPPYVEECPISKLL